MGRKTNFICFLALGALSLMALVAFISRYIKRVTFTDLSAPQTQSVSIAFLPTSVRWSVSATVNGTGTVIIPYLFSNTISGSFSTNGAGDYYDSNASVIFLPEAQPRGRIRAAFRFSRY